jgi:uncharacterized membrane protein YphA (DoxX/SURF4 family)
MPNTAYELALGIQIHMHTTILAAFLEFSRTVSSMCTAAIVLFLVALWAAKTDIARVRGLDKIVALSNLCFAAPLAVFGALHLAAADSLKTMVPSYMPWPLFWAYFFGFALLAASLSIATKIQVRWSGLLFGIAMFLFVAMLDIPGSLANPRDRIGWTLTLREMLFGGGGWILAGNAMREQGHGKGGSKLITVGRVIIGIAAIFYGIENSLHPANVPGVPLEKLMPAWIPAHLLIAYLTGAILVVAGVCILLNKKTRMAATYLGTWIVLLVVFIYGPILIASLADPSTGVKVEGINYFFDTMLFAGAILALANATPRTD